MSLFPLLEIISVQLSVYIIIIMEIKAVELCFLDILNQYTVRIKFLNTCIQFPQSFNLFHHKRPHLTFPCILPDRVYYDPI